MNLLKWKSKSYFGRIWLLFLKIVLIFLFVSVGSVILLRWVNPRYTPLMIIRLFDQKVNNKKLKLQYHWVDIEDISPSMPRAVIAGEDGYFLFHNGFDWDAIARARKYNETHKIKRGASTISQQTAKNVFLWPDRSWIRKGLETYFTFLIELFWSKERIMEVYLNVIEYGDGIYGVDKAAQEYFKKPAKNLTMEEAATLAGSLPNPRKWNAKLSPPVLLRRKAIILNTMTRIGNLKLIKHPYNQVKGKNLWEKIMD